MNDIKIGMIYNSSFNVSEITHFYEYNHPQSYVFDGHRHRGYELVVIFNGEIEHVCDGNISHLSKNDFCIIPPYSFHCRHSISNEPVKQTVVHFEAPPNLFGDSPMTYHLTEKTSNIFALFSEDMRNANSEYGECQVVSNTANKLFEVFFEYSDPHFQKSFVVEKKSEIYYKAFNYMQNNIHKKLTLPDIAKACFVSPSTLKTVFSTYTGIGCMDFFNEMKLDRAKKLLSDGLSCAEVSDMLGFSSQSYFSKKFRHTYGIPPSLSSRLK